MNKTIIENKLLGEKYYEVDHNSGLKIFVMEKPDYSGAFAIFGTKYGSVDTCFKLKQDEQFTKVPEGIAHFLEHKLFESEELDAFVRFEKTGASANAFTSFDRTCYLFQCSEKFDENLEILLDFVKSPYFTEETVQKEQGIIGQEIKMYQDSPDWQVLFNLLRAMYHNNPVRIDIAGTVESIADINAELLYSCYNTFYNNSNMALAVAGNVSLEQVLKIADKMLKTEEPAEFEQVLPEEDPKVVTASTEQVFGVDVPKFGLGFKENFPTAIRSAKEIVCMNIALDIIAGKVSHLYSKMLTDELINPTFGSEYFVGRGFSTPLFMGESNEPEKVKDEIIAEIIRLKSDGIGEEDFAVSLKRLYGREIRAFNDVDDLASNLVECYFNDKSLFAHLETYKTITKQDVLDTIENSFDVDNYCLSVIK
ncbi:MAG: pitrilysin family protein [Clostridia bacterium]